MLKRLTILLLTLAACIGSVAQTLNVQPQLSAESGAYDDQVVVACNFPEGCQGGIYWINGGELRAVPYTAPVVIDYSCSMSVAGTDASGRIITDVVTRDFTINHVTPPTIVATPKEGRRKESFYVTRLTWTHATRVECRLDDFKEGGSRHSEHVVWLTGPDGSLVSGGDSNNLWVDGLNSYKAYIYRNYAPTELGEYVLHVASGIFVIDGKTYDKVIELRYTLTDGEEAPVFTPDGGEYKGSVTVSIEYPADGSAFYKIYKIGGQKTKQYNGPITLTETATIEAYGMNESYTAQTPKTTATYTITPADPEPEKISAPTISCNDHIVTIDAPAGTTVKYWLGRKMSTAQLYTAPFSVTENTVVSCVAYKTGAVSPTADLVIEDFVTDRGDKGEQVLLTPPMSESAHLRALSPNGKYAVGYSGSDTSSRGFVWDVDADDVQFSSTQYINQLWDVDNSGTAYGWRTRTVEVDETGDDDLMWATYSDGTWTEVERGSFVGRERPDAPAGYPEVTAVSEHGEWAILGQEYRWNTKTGTVEHLISMSDRYSDGSRPEVLRCIADDGTIFGTYDASLLSPESGVAMVRTNDGRWRSVATWLNEMGYTDLDGYNLTSVCGVTGDKRTLLFHAKQRSMAIDDNFTRGLIFRIDADVRHLAPVVVKATQMSGMDIVKVTWKAPNVNDGQVASYQISRNGTPIATTDGATLVYYDDDIVSDETYTYTITATYDDGTTSRPSEAATITPVTRHHLAPRNLAVRRIGLNDAIMTWDAPVVTLPKLQYFDEESDTYAFGTRGYDAEFGIRIPADELTAYEGKQIRTLQFLPSGPQKSYTINLYRATEGNQADYEAEPFYTQSIDPEALNYGTVNTIALTTPQELTAGRDLYVGVYIEGKGNDNMIGISYEGFRSGYSDLCRVVGVHKKMVSMSQNSHQTTEVVVPIGIGICSEAEYNSSIVDHYEIYDNDNTSATTAKARTRYEQLSEGVHTLGVTAIYHDGKASHKATIECNVVNNDEAYVAVDNTATVNADATATISWQAPLDDDRTLLHYGDLNPSDGWEMAHGATYYVASVAFPADVTAPYADEYEATHIFFCPMADEVFYLSIEDEEGAQLAYAFPETYEVGKVNYIELAEPVTIAPSITYHVVANATTAVEGVTALAYDSSGAWHNGYSNLVNYGYGNSTLSDFVQIGEQPNWLLGMVIHQREARQLPVEGYRVSIDSADATLVTTTSYTTDALTTGNHTSRVDVVYGSDVERTGTTTTFNIDPEGINPITISPNPSSHSTYDLGGRRIINDREGRGLYIINNRKVTH